MQNHNVKITLRAFLLGVLFTAVFAVITVLWVDGLPTATQIPVMPYVLLMASVLLINPLLRLVRVIRQFSKAELLLVFTMGLVSSGISTFGLTPALVSFAGSLFNPAWNNDQTEWNRYIVPYLNDQYFLSVEGISETALDYAQASERLNRKQRIVEAATRYLIAHEQREATTAALETLRAQDPDLSSAQGLAVRRNHSLARERYAEAEILWQRLQERHPELVDPHETRRRYQQRLTQAEAETQRTREALAELEEKAFARVNLFRRGLPEELRAFPGIVKMPEDTRRSYLARFNRTLQGTRAGNQLESLIAETETHAPDTTDMARRLTSVQQALDAMSAAEAPVSADLEDLRERENQMRATLSSLRATLREQNAKRRLADEATMRQLEREIHRGQMRERSLNRQVRRLTENRQNLERQVRIIREVNPLREQVASLASRLESGEVPEDFRTQLMAIQATIPILDGNWRRFLVGDVPWRHWGGILFRWGVVIGLTYLVLMTFNILIFRQWAHNEKLIYPLAELPEILVGGPDTHSEGEGIPPVYRNGLFWLGLAISGSVLGFNALAHSQWIPGLDPISLQNSWAPYIRGTPLAGLLGGRSYARTEIFFTMIGLAFLIPTKVSFSLWFFTILGMIQVLILVGLGHGTSEGSFRAEWTYSLNFRTGQGSGALLVFASVVLYKCRHYLLCAFRPQQLEGLARDEQLELRISSFLFLSGSIGLILVLWLSLGINLWYVIGAFFVIMVLTIGLVRAVAEGGILGFQAWTGPFHFIRTFFGMDRSWTHPSLFAPLYVYYMMLFMDIKTFIAPAMANSLKIREDLRMRRGQFHFSMFAAILVAAVLSVIVAIMMCYHQGADEIGGWFYTSWAQQSTFQRLTDMSQIPPTADPAVTLWTVAGGVTMALLLFLRQSFFWMPHPIGMIMLVNPIMGAYWFSILLGWFAKSLVTKYGSRQAYTKARAMFIGLIVGELLLVTIAMWITARLDIRIPISLNRN